MASLATCTNSFSLIGRRIAQQPRNIAAIRGASELVSHTGDHLYYSLQNVLMTSSLAPPLDHRIYSTFEPQHIDSLQSQRDRLEEDIKRNFTLNVGRAIECLRDDVPNMLTEAPNLDIFSDEVVLADPNGPIVKGKAAYKMFFASLRMARRLTMTTPTVEILSLRYLDWRSEITVRFSVVTESPVPGMDPVHFDAISVYKLDRKGLIYEHRIDDMTRQNLFDRPPLFQGLSKNLLWGTGRGAPMPMPC